MTDHKFVIAPKNEELYTPLDIEVYEIRVLTILPGDLKSPLRCLLKKTTLLQHEPYQALSYHWGDQSVTSEITVNKSQVQITVNLQDALQMLRAMGIQRVWVDAVCINQVDRQERSLQVRLMKQIFSKAIQVIAFVGAYSKSNEEAMSILLAEPPPYYRLEKHHFTESSKSSLQLPALAGKPASASSTDQHNRSQGSPFRERQALDKFFALPYWRRVWIIQELTVAASIKLVCGNKCVSWERLIVANAFYPESGSDAWLYVRKIIRFRNAYQKGARFGLLQVMSQTHDALSTDPRDKIYALLGLSHDGQQLIPYPNYKQTIEEVLIDFTSALFSSNKSLDHMLLGRGACINKQNIPSWCPDWLGTDRNPRGLLHFSANPIHGFNLAISSNPKILLVQGMLIGSVEPLENLSPAISQNANTVENPGVAYYGLRGFINALMACLCLDTNSFDNEKEQSRSDYFSQLWTGDSLPRLRPARYGDILNACRKTEPISLQPGLMLCMPNENNASTQHGVREQQRQMERTVIEWLEDLGISTIAGNTLREIVMTTTNSFILDVLNTLVGPKREKLESNFPDIANALYAVATNKMRLIITAEGLIGIAHARVQSGDKICFLAGCHWPVILRKVNLNNRPAYRVVGSAMMRFQQDDKRRNLDNLRPRLTAPFSLV